jgi:hypothetical protein
MAISYSGIVGYGKASLPSVESWGTNNNILKDPPKSITTRRRDKVGSNSSITEDIDMSGDRVAEAILAYPRGVNPMVGVSYNGQGNAGIGTGQALFTLGRQAKLPYPVMKDGAFRPPLLAPVDLLPLSRMPRNLTKIDPTICNPDFTKKISCSADKKTFIQKPLKANCQSKVLFNIKKPSVIGISGQVKDSILTNNVNSAIKFKTGLERNLNAGSGRKIRDNIQRPMNVEAGRVGNIFVNRNVNTSGKITDAIHAKTLKGQIICPSSSKLSNRSQQLYGKKILTRVACNPTNVVSNKNCKIYKSGAGEGIQQRGSFINDHSLLIQASTAQSGPIKFSNAPTSLAGNRTRDVLSSSITPTTLPRRATQERPEYKRIFGMGGILAPEGGSYNTAKY